MTNKMLRFIRSQLPAPLPSPASLPDPDFLGKIAAEGAGVGLLILAPAPEGRHKACTTRWMNGAARALLDGMSPASRDRFLETWSTARIDPELDIEVETSEGVTLPIRAKSRRIEQAGSAAVLVTIEDPARAKADRLSSIGQLLGSMAHELNNPLGAIRLHRDVLSTWIGDHAEGEEKADLEESLEIISDCVEQIKRTISSLRKISPTPQNLRRVPINDLVSLVLKSTAARVRGAAVDLDVRLDPAAGAVNVDGQLVEQALSNLLANAIDAVSLSGNRRITLTTARAGDRVRCSIEDHGPGIPEGNRPKIFDPFFTTKRAGKGIGLGLCVARAIARAHLGDIEFQSRTGQGTTFSFTLPSADSRASRALGAVAA